MVSGEGNGNPLQYSCLENSMDGGAWCAKVHGGGKEFGTTEQPHFLSFTCNPSSQAREWTHIPCVARQILTTGPPGKSLSFFTRFCPTHFRSHQHLIAGLWWRYGSFCLTGECPGEGLRTLCWLEAAGRTLLREVDFAPSYTTAT